MKVTFRAGGQDGRVLQRVRLGGVDERAENLVSSRWITFGGQELSYVTQITSLRFHHSLGPFCCGVSDSEPVTWRDVPRRPPDMIRKADSESSTGMRTAWHASPSW